MKNTTQHLGRFALSGVVFASLALACNLSWALGLGRLSVQSTLGETLRAEIDVTSLTPEEAANLKVRIASPDAYRSAGIEYNAVLPSAQATLLRRPDGRAFLRLTSDKIVQEPFVDVILELSWSSGRLVREYTLLFDPPSDRALAAAPAYAPEASTAPVVSAPAPASPPSPKPRAAAAPAPAPAPAPAAERAPKPADTAAASQASSADEYRVRSGDTLTGVAAKTRRAGVSLDQMLVSLYRTNPQAFIENNMNRLKSGAVLAVPSSETAAAIAPAEARQVIQAQSADFSAFRQRLAGAVPAVQADAPARKATGTVQASVEDRKTSTAAAPDKLTLSKGTAAAKGASEAKVSKELEAKDTSTRVAELSKNVDELRKLSGAASATVSAAAAASGPIAGPAVTPPAAVVAATAPASAPVADVPASVAAPAAPVVAAAAASAAETPAAPPPAPVPEDPSFIDTLLADPLTLGAGGVVIAGLLGFGLYRARKSKVDSGETSFLESRLQPDSFFGASGGQRIDTREAATGTPSSMSYSLSQLDAIGDVDPVAEADVYLAYGRDLQAEEILKEALRATPDRMAIRTKLLEVYAKRRDTKGYELLAIQLHSLTGGSGEDWEKAQSMGRDIDPDNPLYQPGGAPESMLDHRGGVVSEPLGASTMPQSVLPTASTFGVVPAAAMPSVGDGIDLDLDLDNASFAAESIEPALESFSFEPAPTPVAAQAYYPETPVAASPAPSAPDFDLSDISLDLDSPSKPLSTGAVVDDEPDIVTDDDVEDPNIDPMARKLELADEFRDIGDVEGARDLLQEVAAKAEGTLKAKAQAMLDDMR